MTTVDDTGHQRVRRIPSCRLAVCPILFPLRRKSGACVITPFAATKGVCPLNRRVSSQKTNSTERQTDGRRDPSNTITMSSVAIQHSLRRGAAAALRKSGGSLGTTSTSVNSQFQHRWKSTDAGDVIGIDLGTTNSCVSVMVRRTPGRKNRIFWWSTTFDDLMDVLLDSDGNGLLSLPNRSIDRSRMDEGPKQSPGGLTELLLSVFV